MGNLDEEVEWIIPAQAGYKDRKMAKWEGFILAEHAEMLYTLAQYQQRKLERKPKAKQSAQLISELLQQAFETKQPVTLQMDFVENGMYEEDIIGVVKGVEAKWVHVQTKDDFVAVDFQLIRNVSLIDSVKWYEE